MQTKLNKTKTHHNTLPSKYFYTADSLPYLSPCNELKSKPVGLGFNAAKALPCWIIYQPSTEASVGWQRIIIQCGARSQQLLTEGQCTHKPDDTAVEYCPSSSESRQLNCCSAVHCKGSLTRRIVSTVGEASNDSCHNIKPCRVYHCREFNLQAQVRKYFLKRGLHMPPVTQILLQLQVCTEYAPDQPTPVERLQKPLAQHPPDRVGRFHIRE